MAALSAAAQRRYRVMGKSVFQNFRVANTKVIYVGSFCGLATVSYVPTTAYRGYLLPMENTANVDYAGLCIGAGTPGDLSTTNTITGSTSATPIVEAGLETGSILLEQYTVTGASAQSDIDRKVYFSNDNDLTITSNNTAAAGRILFWWSSTTCDVLIYGQLAGLVI